MIQSERDEKQKGKIEKKNENIKIVPNVKTSFLRISLNVIRLHGDQLSIGSSETSMCEQHLTSHSQQNNMLECNI